MTERRVQQIISTITNNFFGEKFYPNDLRTTHIIKSFLRREPIHEIEKRVGIKSIQPYIYKYFKSIRER